MIKKIFFLLIFLIFPFPTFAAENWSIEKYSSQINILQSGEVSIVETIETNFNESMHGIYRDIPYVYLNKDGSKRYTEIKIKSVKRNSKNEDYKVTSNDNHIRIRIGDPDKTIAESHIYEISYSAIGVLDSYETFDEFYWNVTGNGWNVPIKETTVIVKLPKPGITQTACYEGAAGSSENCKVLSNDQQSVNFNSNRSYNSYEGLTIAVGYTKGLVPILEGKPPKKITDDLFGIQSITTFFATSLLGFLAVIYLWTKKGRDFWFKSRFIHDPLARAEIKPLGTHETLVVEYDSPEKLRPAEIGALMDGTADTLDVTATLVDLANRGFLTITEEPKKWLFGSKDYILAKTEKVQEGLLNYEKELLDRLFDEGEIVSLSSLKNKFYRDLAKVKEKLYQHMVAKKFFVENPQSVRTFYAVVGVIIALIGGAGIWLGFQLILAIGVSLGAGLVLVGIFLLIMSSAMPRRTAEGRQLYNRAKGYRLFIEKAEKYRQQFFERKNIFNEVLPYAIVFGLTEKFAQAFKDMGLKPEQPSWYSSSRTFNAAAFGASMNSFSTSFSSAIASSPSSSGSGGGGSSGGGGGGGGGGGW